MDWVITEIDALLTMDPTTGEGPLGVIHHAAVAVSGGEIAWVGPTEQAPAAAQQRSGAGSIGMPGLIDCHTHLAYAGSRAEEFRQRLAGVPYTEIAARGGGILSTMRATRAAPTEALAALLRARLDRALSMGITTAEVKTGYGLSVPQEARLLRLIAEARHPVALVPTLLAAHTVPPEFAHDRDGWLDAIERELLPLAGQLGAHLDIYCDVGAYTLAEAERLLTAGKAAGLKLHAHAEQIAWTGVAALAGRLGACSADHLERLDADGAAAMAAGGTVGVILPGARMYLRDTPPPVALLREAGVPMAVATDFNPGTSPVADLWACATLACVENGLTLEEAMLGVTRNAARALGLGDRGVIAPGKRADLALFHPPIGEPAHWPSLLQHFGGHRAHTVFAGGSPVVLPGALR